MVPSAITFLFGLTVTGIPRIVARLAVGRLSSQEIPRAEGKSRSAQLMDKR